MNTQKQLVDIHHSGKPYIIYKSKKGFAIPVGDWLRTIFKERLLHYSNKKLLIDQNIFIPENIIFIINNHLEGKKDNTFKIWTFFCFQHWYFNIYK